MVLFIVNELTNYKFEITGKITKFYLDFEDGECKYIDGHSFKHEERDYLIKNFPEFKQKSF